MNLNLSKAKINYKKLALDSRNFFATKSRLFLVFISVMLLAYCGYLWYRFIFHPQWSEARRQEYVNMQVKEVIFDQKKFDMVVNEIKDRKDKYNNKTENMPNIFRLK